MRDLIEHILDENYVSASDSFESYMNDIVERKLYENKRMMQTEVVKPVKGKPGQFTGQNTPKDWAKYRKTHPALGMYDVPGGGKAKKPEGEKTASGGLTKKGIAIRKRKGYLKAYPALKSLEFIKRVTQYHKTGKVEESIAADIAAAAKEQQAAAGRAGAYTHGRTSQEEPPRDISSAKKSGKKSGAPEKPKVEPQAGFPTALQRQPKKLSPGKTVSTRTSEKPVGVRFLDSLSRARRLQSRGKQGAVGKVLKTYAAPVAKGAVGAAIKGVGKELSSLSNI